MPISILAFMVLAALADESGGRLGLMAGVSVKTEAVKYSGGFACVSRRNHGGTSKLERPSQARKQIRDTESSEWLTPYFEAAAASDAGVMRLAIDFAKTAASSRAPPMA